MLCSIPIPILLDLVEIFVAFPFWQVWSGLLLAGCLWETPIRMDVPCSIMDVVVRGHIWWRIVNCVVNCVARFWMNLVGKHFSRLNNKLYDFEDFWNKRGANKHSSTATTFQLDIFVDVFIASLGLLVSIVYFCHQPKFCFCPTRPGIGLKPWSCWTEARWNKSKTILSPTIHSSVPWIWRFDEIWDLHQKFDDYNLDERILHMKKFR